MSSRQVRDELGTSWGRVPNFGTSLRRVQDASGMWAPIGCWNTRPQMNVVMVVIRSQLPVVMWKGCKRMHNVVILNELNGLPFDGNGASQSDQ